MKIPGFYRTQKARLFNFTLQPQNEKKTKKLFRKQICRDYYIDLMFETSEEIINLD